MVPSSAVLQEEIDVVGGFGEVCELDNVAVVYALPGLDFVLEGIDEVLLGESFVLAEIDLVDEVLLLDHLAGEYFVGAGVDGEVGFGEAAFAELLLLDLVSAVNNFDGVNVLDADMLRIVCLILHSRGPCLMIFLKIEL